MEAGLEAVDYYDPPNLTFPFGSYICVVDIDKGTGQVHVRRFVAVDDCGNIINPMIVDGQIHGGLTMGLAPSLYEEITYDEQGNNLAGTFMDYLLPTAMETPAWETGKTITPSPHHPLGAKGVGESATVGAPPAIANAVVDALSHLGVDAHRHPDHAPEGLGDPAREGRRLTPCPGRACFPASPSSRQQAGRSRSPRSWRSSVPPRPGRGRWASSTRTARSRAGSAAAAPSPSSCARRSGRSSTAIPACSVSRRRHPRRAGAATGSSSSS